MPSGWLGLDWGNVPTWVGSVLTGSSLLIAARTYRRSVLERQREQREREQAQVAKVSVWGSGGRFTVTNGNDVAVGIGAFLDYGYQRSIAVPESFGPGESRGLSVPPGDYDEYCRLAGERCRDRVTSLVVVDSFGRTWVRDPDGILRRQPDGYVERLRRTLHRDGSELRFSPAAAR